MVDPYKAGFFSSNPYALKRQIHGKLAVILQGKLEKRGLNLITTISRVVQKHEVHELIVTDEAEAEPGKTVDMIAYIGFMEISVGGVMVVGDELTCNGRVMGKVAGFDETHLPNHLNIVLIANNRLDGVDNNFTLESDILVK